MQNDTISRSALITDLENRKVTAGDPVIKFLFDRLIDIMKEQPAVAAEKVVRCDECRHYEPPDEGDYLGRCLSGMVAVSNGGEIYPGRGFYCLYGEPRDD